MDSKDTDPALRPLAKSAAEAVAAKLRPGNTVLSMSLLPGSFSNSTWSVTLRDPSGDEETLAVRRYRGGWSEPAPRARREFEVFRLLHGGPVPVPQPLLLDETGELLGAPGIVTSFVEGRQVIAPPDDPQWAAKLARTLAEIHTADAAPARKVLLNANTEALYFLRGGKVTDDMEPHPDGERLWHAVAEAAPALKPEAPVLTHLDYWTGNVLWKDGKVAAVVDWEEASYGDPAIDVAYVRLDLCGAGLRQEADDFAAAYRKITGRSLRNLAFWELAAAARPMPDPGNGVDELKAMGYDRMTADDLRRNLREFIADAFRRLG